MFELLKKYYNNSNINIYLENIGFYIVISIYVISLIEKIFDFSNLQKSIESKNIPFPSITPYIVILLLLVGTLFSISYKLNYLEYTYGKIGIDVLIIFTILATYYFHNVFVSSKQRYYFEKNVAIIGSLLFIRSTIK
jgi:uncharacterized membrane protein YphA (DoxX/SURF4 family)